MSVGQAVFGVEEERAKRYRGFNPAFVRRVWRQRREVVASVAEPVKPPSTFEERAMARHREVERLRVERLKARIEAGGVRGIIAEVALAHRVTVEDILGPGRSKPLVKARHQAIIEVALRRPAYSLSQIGRCFSRDHTTILHALQKYGIRGGTP